MAFRTGPSASPRTSWQDGLIGDQAWWHDPGLGVPLASAEGLTNGVAIQMVIYSSSSSTAKSGINYIRTVVESSGSLFHKIEQESDLGIDAIVEIIDNGRPTSRQVALQIKSGGSYFTRSGLCRIPVSSHREYWLKYPMPVCGVVFVPGAGTAYWCDLKRELALHGGGVIRYPALRINQFDRSGFARIFVPTLQGACPLIEIEELSGLLASGCRSERFFALRCMFSGHQDSWGTWREIIDDFESDVPACPIGVLVYWISHIPWHPDLIATSSFISPDARCYGLRRIANFGVREVLKLLSAVSEEEGIARGTLGQCVDAIVSTIPNVPILLRDIIGKSSFPASSRKYAALIYAYRFPDEAIVNRKLILDVVGGELIVESLQRWGAIRLYE